MRKTIIGNLALLSFAVLSPAATPKAPLTPKLGIKTPGVQIPFAGVAAEATLPATDKPAGVFLPTDAPAAPGPAARRQQRQRAEGAEAVDGAVDAPEAVVADAAAGRWGCRRLRISPSLRQAPQDRH